MCASKRAISQPGIGYSDDLGGPIVAVSVDGVGAHDRSPSVLVVFLEQYVVLDPGYVQHLGQGYQLGLIGHHNNQVP